MVFGESAFAALGRESSHFQEWDLRGCSVRQIVLEAGKYWTKKVAWSSEFFFPGQAPAALVMSWHYHELLLSIYSSQDIFHSNWVCCWTRPMEFVRLGEHKQAKLILLKRASNGIILMTKHFIRDPSLQVPDTLHCENEACTHICRAVSDYWTKGKGCLQVATSPRNEYYFQCLSCLLAEKMSSCPWWSHWTHQY